MAGSTFMLLPPGVPPFPNQAGLTGSAQRPPDRRSTSGGKGFCSLFIPYAAAYSNVLTIPAGECLLASSRLLSHPPRRAPEKVRPREQEPNLTRSQSMNGQGFPRARERQNRCLWRAHFLRDICGEAAALAAAESIGPHGLKPILPDYRLQIMNPHLPSGCVKRNLAMVFSSTRPSHPPKPLALRLPPGACRTSLSSGPCNSTPDGLLMSRSEGLNKPHLHGMRRQRINPGDIS
jgi:hypothetical protein